jgi:hypothetical protein
MSDNVRVQSAVSATSSGNLTWERWPYDVATALGFAGQRNPLGFAVVRFLSDTPNSAEVWNIVLVLATVLIRKGIDKDLAREAAWKGFEFWNDSRCKVCHGRGISGATQQPCTPCGGSGDRVLPSGPASTLMAISELIEAEYWMERQLGSRLKGAAYQADPDGYRVSLPALSGSQDSGFNSRSDTGFHGRSDSD